MADHADIDHTGLTGIPAAGSVATDAIWDAAGDLAVGSGANTAAKLSKGTALQVLRVNSGATNIEWATPSASTPPDCKESAMTTNVTMGTPNTWTDSGMSISLATGTWLVRAELTIRITQSGTDYAAIRLIESGGSSTVYANVGMNLLSNTGQEIPFTCSRRITLGSTTTVKVQGLAQNRTAVLVADTASGVTAADILSYMTALSVTSA